MDGINYKTTDVAKWGAGSGTGTGGNLSPTQLDLNFWELYTRLKTIEDNPPSAVNISGFTIVGSQLQVNMNDGTHFGPYTLPIAIFELKGDWANSAHYYEMDVVSVPQVGLFLVRIEHDTPASPAEFDPNATDGLTPAHPLYLKLFGENVYIYDFGFFYPGRPGNGIEVGGSMAGHIFVRNIVMPFGLPGSKAKLKTAPAVDLSFPIAVNGVTKGSVDFASGQTVGTFTWPDDVTCAINDVVTMIRPTAIDANAREVQVTFLTTRTF